MQEIVSKGLDSIDKFLDVIEAAMSPNPEKVPELSLNGILIMLAMLEMMDSTGAFSEDIEAGRIAVANMDLQGGRDAVANAREKLI